MPLKARDIIVEIKKKSIKIAVKGQDPIISGELPKEIKVNFPLYGHKLGFRIF